MNANNEHQILWLDLETTGLDESRHLILEVGAFLTTSLPEASMIWSFGEQTVRCGNWRNMANAEVQAMHQASGLAARLDGEFPGSGLDEIEAEICDRIPPNTVLAGNSISFDRRFIRKYMPRLDQKLHYRMFDVRTLIMFAESMGWRSRLTGTAAHRAMADALYSYDTFREIRDCMQVVA